MLEQKCERLSVPEFWTRLHMEDFTGHMTYPALVQEMSQGWVSVYGRLPHHQPSQSSPLAELASSANNVRINCTGK